MVRRPKYPQGQGSAAQVEGAGCVGISDCIQWGGKTSSPAGEWGSSFLLSLVVFLASSSTCEWINAGSEEYLDDEMTGVSAFCSPPSRRPHPDLCRARSSGGQPVPYVHPSARGRHGGEAAAARLRGGGRQRRTGMHDRG
jgi:hypothetical protein